MDNNNDNRDELIKAIVDGKPKELAEKAGNSNIIRINNFFEHLKFTSYWGVREDTPEIILSEKWRNTLLGIVEESEERERLLGVRE